MIKILLVFFFFTLYCFHRAVHKITKSTLYYQNQTFFSCSILQLVLERQKAATVTITCLMHCDEIIAANAISLPLPCILPLFFSALSERRDSMWPRQLPGGRGKKKRSCSQIPDERFVLAILINHELAPSKSLSCGMNYYSQLLFPTFSVRCAPKALSDELSNTANYVKCVHLNTFQTGCCKTITSKWKKYTTMQAHRF